MSKHEDIDPRDERALQALFDETAAPPTQHQLHRMARAAAQIPDRKPVGLLAWFSSSIWRPSLAFGTVGAAALAAWLLIGGQTEAPSRAPVAELTAPVPSATPTAEIAPLEDGEPIDLDGIELAAEDEPELVQEDTLAGLHGDFDDSALAALDLLFAPDDEEELDLWTAAFGSDTDAIDDGATDG